MGVAPDIANAALRLSLGCLSTEADVQRTIDVLVTLAEKSRVGKAASAACAQPRQMPRAVRAHSHIGGIFHDNCHLALARLGVGRHDF
jgi:hypothetical protein